MKTLKIHERDNVAVVLGESDSVPVGHKLALEPIQAGGPVIKYGYPIGTASATIAEGEWVHDHNVKTALSGTLDYTYEPDFQPLGKIDDATPLWGIRAPTAMPAFAMNSGLFQRLDA